MSASILIVDDSPLISEIISNALKDFGCEILRAGTGAKALEIVRSEVPDLVLLDVVMPDMIGYDVCKAIKQNPLTANIPIIFITSTADSKSVVRGFEAGGVDYIAKPFNNHELRARTKAHLTNKLMADKMRVLNETLSEAVLENRRLATEDPLTKLYNRRTAYDNIRRRFGSGINKIGIILSDIDNFKKINDTYGHNYGDYVLCVIAGIIKDTVGTKGVVCRWGGEEFLIALTGAASADAVVIGNAICGKIREEDFFFNDIHIKCGITAGVVITDSSDTFDNAIASADTALYEGKAQGKDRCVQYSAVRL